MQIPKGIQRSEEGRDYSSWLIGSLIVGILQKTEVVLLLLDPSSQRCSLDALQSLSVSIIVLCKGGVCKVHQEVHYDTVIVIQYFSTSAFNSVLTASLKTFGLPLVSYGLPAISCSARDRAIPYLTPQIRHVEVRGTLSTMCSLISRMCFTALVSEIHASISGCFRVSLGIVSFLFDSFDACSRNMNR